MRYRLLCFLLLAAVIAPARAQRVEPSSPPSHNLDDFAPLDFQDPNDYRAASGRTGPDYWQQRADYNIQVTLNPETNRLSGTETITYTNNAPQALDYLWVQLDQNLFAPDSRGAALTTSEDRFSGAFEGGGFDLMSVELIRNGQRTSPEHLIDGTRLRITLGEPLPAQGGQLKLAVDFAFTIPPYGADRMGRLDVEQGTVYQLAQWYPRMYVFDDVNGWNALPYLGQGEYYLEYGTFNVDITVPRDFLVMATGSLQNPEEVLTATQRRRLDQARQSEETVRIVMPEEVGTADSRPEGEEMMTWRYHGESIRDFAWAASQAFIWDAAGYEDMLVMSAYPREGLGTQENPGWEKSTAYSRHAIKYYSEQWYDYPYPVAINVAGRVRGMEYPQIVFCGVEARGQSLFGVTDHELGHQWVPMIVGSDERRHAWMDEGLNTFMNHYSGLAYYGNDFRGARGMSGAYAARRMQQTDQPILTYADRIRRSNLGFAAYRKPAKGLVLLREYILGEERFDPAFREYIRRWAYKHPQPADFFRTIEDVAGEDLDWFWRGWFNTTATFDQAIADVSTQDSSTTVTIANRSDLFMPATLEIQYEDGHTARQRVPVEAFFTSDQYRLALEGDVTQVRLDPEHVLPDVNRSNDVWSGTDGATSGE